MYDKWYSFQVSWNRTQISDVLTLSILHVTPQDAGNYQCQVSSPNKISKSVELLVIRPQVTTNYKIVNIKNYGLFRDVK